MTKPLKPNKAIDLHYVLQFIKRHVLLIALCLCIAIFCAFLVNKYSKNIYNVTTSILVHDKDGGMMNTSAQILNELGFSATSKNFANELQVLSSSPMIASAIRMLDFQISYYEEEWFSKRELYKSSPFIIILDKNYPQPIGVEFEVKILDETSCSVSISKNDVLIYSFVSNSVVQKLDNVEFDKVVKLNKYIYSDFMRFKILLNSSVDISDVKDKTYSFRINTEQSLVNMYKSMITVLPPDLEATVAKLQLKTDNPEKGIDFLNMLTESYVSADLDRKRHTSVRTIQYINDQLNAVGDSLKNAELKLQTFRSTNEVTDISTQSDRFFDDMRELENQKATLEVNQKYYEYVKNYFNKNKEFDELIAPSAMGIADPMLNNLIEELIRLNAERASFVENNQGKSPYLKKINIRIENLRKMVSENIAYYKQTNGIKLSDIDARIEKLNGEISKLPAAQRQLVGITRKYNVNDGIYTYLLEKRAEAEIARTSYVADCEVIEPAVVEGGLPIAPKKSLNYFIAAIIGIFIPISILRLFELVKTSIGTENEAEELLNFPVLGKIYHNDKSKVNVVEEYPQKLVTENFRHLFVGLKYFLKNAGCKTILISSTTEGEGKSFIALNTSITLANKGYKTIVLSFDLRKVGLSAFLKNYGSHRNIKNVGLTEYMTGQMKISDIIRKTHNENLDFIMSGTIAPNPGELISSEQSVKLFDDLKLKYDYIIVDTSPIGLVSDAYNLMNFADLNIIVLRLKKTPRGDFEKLQQDLVEKDIKACMVINDLYNKRRSGYGYYSEKRKID